MICLAHDHDDKNPRSRKVTKKSSFLSWGLKNKLKSASTLSLPTDDHSGSLPWNKPCPTFPSSSSYNNDSALYWARCRLPLALCCTPGGLARNCRQMQRSLWISGHELASLWCSGETCQPQQLSHNTVRWCFCGYLSIFSEQFWCLLGSCSVQPRAETCSTKPAWVQHSVPGLGKQQLAF